MPGSISDSFQGPAWFHPYCPPWCYPNSEPMMCECGHHEGYHNDAGHCLLRAVPRGIKKVPAHVKICGCPGLAVVAPVRHD